MTHSDHASPAPSLTQPTSSRKHTPRDCQGQPNRTGSRRVDSDYNAKWNIIRVLNEGLRQPHRLPLPVHGAADLADVTNTPIHMDSGINRCGKVPAPIRWFLFVSKAG
jgi:hypothetical protein